MFESGNVQRASAGYLVRILVPFRFLSIEPLVAYLVPLGTRGRKTLALTLCLVFLCCCMRKIVFSHNVTQRNVSHRQCNVISQNAFTHGRMFVCVFPSFHPYQSQLEAKDKMNICCCENQLHLPNARSNWIPSCHDVKQQLLLCRALMARMLGPLGQPQQGVVVAWQYQQTIQFSFPKNGNLSELQCGQPTSSLVCLCFRLHPNTFGISFVPASHGSCEYLYVFVLFPMYLILLYISPRQISKHIRCWPLHSITNWRRASGPHLSGVHFDQNLRAWHTDHIASTKLDQFDLTVDEWSHHCTKNDHQLFPDKKKGIKKTVPRPRRQAVETSFGASISISEYTVLDQLDTQSFDVVPCCP